MDIKVKNKMRQKFLQWRHVELWAVVSSIFGLIIALTNYEIGLYVSSDLGLGSLNYDYPSKNSKEMINEAINKRMQAPQTTFLRWCNFASCWITIALLIRRNQLKTAWTNKYFRGQLYLEQCEQKVQTFFALDDAAETADIDPHLPMAEQMAHYVDFTVPVKKFFSFGFALEIIS